MASITLKCPKCQAENMTCPIQMQYQPPREYIVAKGLRPYGVIGAACGKCWHPISAEVTVKSFTNSGQIASFSEMFLKALNMPYDLQAGGLRAEIIITPSQDSEIPEHLSESVAKAFRAAERNYAQPDCEDAAAMLYRRAIDVAIKEKHPEISGLLAVRINRLASDGLIPPAMKEWADQIRLIGNEGAHEPEGVSMDDLKPMKGFTESFLRYFITLPYEVALRRGEIPPA